MTDKNDTLDMLELARFAVLAGAGRLVRAFSQIPEGVLRDATIAHAEAIAQTYAGAPAHQRMPDPINGFAPAKPALTAPKSPSGRTPKIDSDEAMIVQMRLSGKLASQIIRETGLPKDRVYSALKAAKAAGVDIPRVTVALDGQGSASSKWHTSIETMTKQGKAQVQNAAARRGITAEAYMGRRALALKLAMEGASYDTILKATGEHDSKVVSTWLSNARGAGFNVPYVTYFNDVTPKAEPEPAPKLSLKPRPAPDPQTELHVGAAAPKDAGPAERVFPDFTALPLATRLIVQKAAFRRKMTVQAYQDLRESIVRHRLDGKTNTEIAHMTGEPRFFVRDIVDAAVARGVTFPPEIVATEAPATARKEAAG